LEKWIAISTVYFGIQITGVLHGSNYVNVFKPNQSTHLQPGFRKSQSIRVEGNAKDTTTTTFNWELKTKGMSACIVEYSQRHSL